MSEASPTSLILTWNQENCDVRATPWLSRSGPPWKQVVHRRVIDLSNDQVLDDQAIHPGTPQHKTVRRFDVSHAHVRTEFSYHGSEVQQNCELEWMPSAHQYRQLETQAKICLAVHDHSRATKRKCLVMEVFSPPRFKTIAEEAGFNARSYDLKTGFDFRRPADRKAVERDLHDDFPDLLVLCPPCTDEGGWFHLNSAKWDRVEYLRRRSQSRAYIKWCCKLFRMQVQLGGRAVLEHPSGSRLWTYPEVQSLCRVHDTVKLHMCRYGLQLPGSDRFIRKSTRLLVTHADMHSLGLLCTGEGNHSCHDVVAGHATGVPRVSEYAGQYPPDFVKAVLRALDRFHDSQPMSTNAVKLVCMLEVVDDSVPTETWPEVCAIGQIPAKTDEDLMPVIQRLHKNLGHPPNSDLVRILKHGQASEQALRLAKDFTCEFCKSQARPSCPLPAQPNRVAEFNHQIGVDVKHLRGWLPNQKIRAKNIVDTASGFQRMIPFFDTETASLLRRLLSEHWIAWAGVPREIVLDPARTNLGEPMTGPAELDGIHIRPIAAGAHWQLGKCESHGGWFGRVLDKLIDSFNPSSKEQWLECVAHAHVKNQMLQVHGFSPHQFVFGRNPNIPQDLLSEPLSIVAGTASLTDEGLAKSQAMRTAARTALIQMQDDRAMRVALLARPRKAVTFSPGDLAAYWRNQKWVQGQLQLGGQWYGVAVILGRVGRNYVLVHRRQVIRCAPEQLRPATNEEKNLIATPEVEMLGIKDLIDKGNLQSKQYIDLLHQSYPPQEDPSISADSEQLPHVEAPEEPSSRPSAEQPEVGPAVPPADSQPAASPGSDANMPELSMARESPIKNTEAQNPPGSKGSADENRQSEAPSGPSEAASTYGPVRRRVSGKDGPMSLWRPAALRQDDFVEVMREVVPQLVQDVVMNRGDKRPLSPGPASSESASRRPRLAEDEALSIQEVHDIHKLVETETIECLVNEYIKKKMSKELHHSNNPPKLQAKVQEGKRTEWETISSKPHAVKVHYGKAAQKIKEQFPDRFIGSRFVLTRKPIEEGLEVNPDDWDSFTVKGRWCLQGHLDPDLSSKAEQGTLKSPTLSQLARNCLMQTMASNKWELQLGDIKGAFLEAGPLDQAFRPLYASQPAGGIPGTPADAVIEVFGNVYGQNDAPAAWFREFSNFVKDIGWHQSVLDPCLFTLRESSGELVGCMGVHVDDTAVGGHGQVFHDSIRRLKDRFPYRKWRQRVGEFCGAWYKQGNDFSIHMDMNSFASKVRSINVPKASDPDTPLSEAQIKVLRAVNGSLNWLSSQTRPDLSVQTSLSQQSFPKPTISDLRMANQAIRRAKQHGHLGITFKSIDPAELTFVCHSDAAFANRGHHTQAGYILGFTEKKLQDGFEAKWCPVAWRSFRLQRAVSSTLGR